MPTMVVLVGVFALVGVVYFWQRQQQRERELEEKLAEIERLQIESQQLATDLEMINHIGRRVNASDDVDSIMQQVVEFAREQLGFYLVSILFIDPYTDEIVNRVSTELATEKNIIHDDRTEELVDAAIATQENVYATSVHMQSEKSAAENLVETRSETVFPLVVDGNVLGALDVQSDRADRFTAREKRVLEALAIETANAIDKLSQFEMQRERAWVTVAQLQVSEAISESASLHTMIETVAYTTGMVMGLAQCGIVLWDEGAGVFRPKILTHAPANTIERFMQSDLRRNQWRALDAAHVGQAEIESTSAAPWMDADPLTPIFLYPLRSKGQLLGVLFVVSRYDIVFTPFQLRLRLDLIRNIARQTAQGVERELLREAQQQEAWSNIALLQVAQAVNRLIDLNEILATIVRLVPLLVGVDSALILVWDEDSQSFWAGPSYGISEIGRGLLDSFGIEESEVISLREETQEIRTELPLYSASPPQWMRDALGVDSAEMIPLHARGERVGLLVVGRNQADGSLTGARLGLLAGIAQQAAIAVVNDGVYKKSAESVALGQQIAVARSIQASLIPDGSPAIPNHEVASYWGAALQVSGDFYDFLKLPNGLWGIVVADVAGKGIPAAIYMALSRTIIRSVGFGSVNWTSDPDRAAGVLRRVNSILLSDAQTDLFVTAFYSLLNPITGDITFCNGGHNPPLILKPSGATEIVGGYGVALGIIEGVPLTQHMLNLAPNDTLIIYTDGITEAMDIDQNPFGLQRLRDTLKHARPQSARQTCSVIMNAVRDFSQNTPQSDDETLVVIRRTP